MSKSFGILTKDEIEKLIIADIKDEYYFAPASYDFRLGNEYVIPNENGALFVKKCTDNSGVLVIPAFTSVLVSSYEKVKLPNNVAGRFDLRLQLGLKGCILQVGTQIEPGYEGILVGLLHNFSNKEIQLPYASRECKIFTAEFNYTSKKVTVVKKAPVNELEYFINKYKDTVSGSLKEYVNSIADTTRRFEISSEKKLSEILKVKEDVEETRRIVEKASMNVDKAREKVQDRFIIIVVGVLTLFLSIGVPTITTILVTKWTYDKDDLPYDKVLFVERKIDSLNIAFTIEMKKKDTLLTMSKNRSDYLYKMLTITKQKADSLNKLLILQSEAKK